MKGFEQFVHKQYSATDTPVVTITKTKLFNFNSYAMKHIIKGYDHISLFFNKEKSQVGFKLLTEETDYSYPIRKSRRENLGSISGIAFLKYYKIAPKDTKRYKIDYDDEEKMMVINIKEPINKKK